MATVVAAAAFTTTSQEAEGVGRVPVRAVPASTARAMPEVATGASDFMTPVAGYASISPFGLRQLPWERSARLHAGVDIAAPMGTPVRAVARGVVSSVGRAAGYGEYVLIRHALGVTSLYAHLSGVGRSLRVGQAVEPGAIVGAVGSTGASTGAHLHFELRDETQRPLDPALFLGRAFGEPQAWPISAARRIPPGVRMAKVSNIPAQFRELMIAQAEAGLQPLSDQVYGTRPPGAPAAVQDAQIQLVALEAEVVEAPAVTPEAVPTIVVEAAPELMPPEEPAVPRRKPRLAMPD